MPETKDQSVRRRYDFIARYYDSLPFDVGDRRRAPLWRLVRGKILEVGVGTGKNIPFYPRQGEEVVGIDLSPGMLAQAKLVKDRTGSLCALQLGDVENLDFPAQTFDTVVSTCVFCTVPDPVAGLREIRRVLRPDGQLVMLEHVRSAHPFTRWLQDRFGPLLARCTGDHIHRDTVLNLRLAGFHTIRVEPLWRDIILIITARP